MLGNFLAVQWLGLGAFIAMAWLQSLVRELRSCKLAVQPKEKKKKKRLRPDLKGWRARHRKLDGKIKGNSNVTLEDH